MKNGPFSVCESRDGLEADKSMFVAELTEEPDGEVDQALPLFAFGHADRFEQQLEGALMPSFCWSAPTTSGSSPDALTRPVIGGI